MRHDVRELREILIRPLQRLLGQLAMSRIAHHFGRADQAARAVAQGHHDTAAPEARAILAQMPPLV